MKKTLTILAILFCTVSYSQKIDTLFKAMTACPIVPFKAQWTDTVNVSFLGVRIISDNLSNTCTLYWALMDTTGAVHVDGNATIAGANYAAWNGSNIYPFIFVGNLYNITFVN